MLFSKVSVLSCLLLASSASSLLSTDKLCFYVTPDLCIKGYNSFNVNYYTEPQNFENQNMIGLLPLSDQDKDSIIKAFDIAREENREIEVTYVLEEKTYKALIIPLHFDTQVSYFLTVVELD